MSEDKRTATQKIEDLEKVVTMLYQSTSQIKNAVENLLKSQAEMGLVRDALKLLNKKTEAIIQAAAPETGITVAAVSNLVIAMNVEDLKAQVAGYVASGHLAPTDEVADNTYLVCEEYNADGTVANPRIQFRLDSQDQETGELLKGKKVGDAVSFGENKFSAKILELYTLTEPKAPEASEAPAAETPPAETTEAPAAAPAEAAPAPETISPPTESPVVVFVPSEPGNMVTAAS
jgi:hypothetical protein